MDAESITVLVERITYTNPQNGYSVLRASCRNHPEGVTIVGTFGPIHPGEEIKAYGVWAHHPEYGAQFHAFKYSVLKPATLKGIEKYLGSGLIKGIGPKTAKRLVGAFGKDCLDIIEKEPEKLLSCEGIGQFRAGKIITGWKEQKAIQDVMVFLQGHGISTAYAVKIYKLWQDKAEKIVGENPYVLAQDVRGIGFKTADKIAAEFGITGEDPRRLNAGILHVLSSALDEGHLFLTREQLKEKSREILAVTGEEPLDKAIRVQLEAKRLVERIWKERSMIYLPFAHRAEEGSFQRMKALLQTSPQVMDRARLLAIIDAAVEKCGVRFSDLQQHAVELSLQKRLLIVTGGPGTGKTTTLQAVVLAQEIAGRRVFLASPTGRAAKRLSEVSGRDALTVHRLLEFSPQEGGFRRKPENPLECDVLIVDEASMIDMELFYSLLGALPRHGVLILVGDVDQLPSVGPGLVLKSLIGSNAVPIVRLETIFRQAEASLIITNAHKINRGLLPILLKPDGKTQTDCYFLEANEPEAVLPLLKNVVGSSLPKKFGYHSLADIQVLTPMNRGSLGGGNLNMVLQEALNPPAAEKAELKHMHRVFRVGDKVIQLRNNYDLEVFNGDIGFIRDIALEDQEMVIEFSQTEKVYQMADILDLAHAYAVTVHKSQGSEYPAVVLLASMQHFMMLQRNLLYTGITRARKTLVLIGSKKALAIAVKNDKVKARNTILQELLEETFPGSDQQQIQHAHDPE